MKSSPAQPRVLVAQLGARRHYLIPLLFQEWGILDSFYTDFYFKNSSLINLLHQNNIYDFLPQGVKKVFDRHEQKLLTNCIICYPYFAYKYASFLKKKSANLSSIWVWSGKEFCQRIIQTGLGNVNVVYGFNGASLELFEYAKQQGIRCILDQTLAERSQVNQLLLEEEKYWNDWSISPFNVKDADLALVQREQQEQDLADQIICGSDFVKNSLVARGVSADKISVVALGRRKDNSGWHRQAIRKTPKERGDGLRILFAGAVGLRKGIPYLLEALRQLKGQIPFTCKAVGNLEIKPQRVAEYSDICEFMGRVPRSHMADLYGWADVFVLPSICEGSAMVTYEALSWGIPTIATHNSGSIVRDGTDGFIISIRNISAIAKHLVLIFDKLNNHDFDSKNTNYFLKNFYIDSEKKLFSKIKGH